MSTASARSNARARLASIPPFPPVASKLLQLLGSDSVQLPRIADLISMDAAFSARVLQQANSLEFAPVKQIKDVQHALSIIGLDRTWQITTTLIMAAYTKAAVRTSGLRRCWQHTVATAVISDQLARACKVHTGTAYTAGVMHDVGRLGLLVAYPAEYEQVIRGAAERCIDLLDYEREQFGIDHAEAGRWLGEKWGLPEELRVVAGRHHDFFDGPELSLVRLVHVSCRLADFLGYDVTRPISVLDFDEIIGGLPESAWRQIRLTPEELRRKVDAAISAHDGNVEPGVIKVPGAEPEGAGRDESFEFALPIQDITAPVEDRRMFYFAGAAGIVMFSLLLVARSCS